MRLSKDNGATNKHLRSSEGGERLRQLGEDKEDFKNGLKSSEVNFWKMQLKGSQKAKTRSVEDMGDSEGSAKASELLENSAFDLSGKERMITSSLSEADFGRIGGVGKDQGGKLELKSIGECYKVV